MPEVIQEQYDKLIRHAEKYIRSPHTSKASAILRWRNMAIRWLKTNAPSYKIAFMMTANPTDNIYERGITPRTVTAVKQGLKILQDANSDISLLKKSNIKKVTPEIMRKVFIVHGHDELMMNSVARFISKLDLEPIILHEQPNEGRTIIENSLITLMSDLLLYFYLVMTKVEKLCNQ